MKTLYDISWQVTEPEYRADPALSYSTIARFDREGFNKLDNLFDKLETPSLTFGSQVDALITGGQEEYDKGFMVADFPEIKDSIKNIVKYLFEQHYQQYSTLLSIPDNEVMLATTILEFQLNWKPETRAKVIKEQGGEYYSLMYLAGDRTIVSTKEKEQVDAAVNALRTSPATAVYFGNDNSIQRDYQLKFKATLNGVDYRCMADLICTDFENKVVYPIDLKTSSHTEWDFYKSFIDWHYHQQARLYWRIIRANMDEDDFFKDFELADYRFIVVNKNTLTPLVWIYEDTKKTGTLNYGKFNQIECRDPEDVGQQLSIYLSSRPQVPLEINMESDNSITQWLQKI